MAMFTIDADEWPGVAKVMEESGELQQVLGKLVQTSGGVEHWDGSNLKERLEEEIADVLAAISFLREHNQCLDVARIIRRRNEKWRRFNEWRAEAAKGGSK